MQVTDDNIHPSTITTTDKVHKCHNRAPFKSYYDVPNGYKSIPFVGRVMQTVSVPHVFTTECMYDVKHIDSQCRGCVWINK